MDQERVHAAYDDSGQGDDAAAFAELDAALAQAEEADEADEVEQPKKPKRGLFRRRS